MLKLPIYFDHNATTPVDPRVFEAMKPYFCEIFGNEASNHCLGRQVKTPCSQARQQIAAMISAPAEDLIITSGATESNNLAIKGMAMALADQGRHIITSQVEHWSVIAACQYLQRQGFDVTYVAPDAHGQVTEQAVLSAVRCGSKGTSQRTTLAAIMLANNEIGTINPIKEIALELNRREVFLHVDAVQGAGKLEIDVKSWGIGSMSLSAHKIYGPKGIGALYLKQAEQLRDTLQPLIHGGGQEGGFRSGTLAVPLLIGFAAACQLMESSRQSDQQHCLALKERFLNALKQRGIPFTINGHPSQRLATNLHLCFEGIEPECLHFAFKNIAVSTTSACSAQSDKPSHVLTSIGLSEQQARQSVRFGFGRSNTEEEIDYAIDEISKVYKSFADVDIDCESYQLSS